MNCVRWSIGDASFHGMGTSLVPRQDSACHPCPWTKLLLMCPDRTVEDKRKIVREADACKTPGAVGALLRREGLYSPHLTTWRGARERGELAGAPKKRGLAARI